MSPVRRASALAALIAVALCLGPQARAADDDDDKAGAASTTLSQPAGEPHVVKLGRDQQAKGGIETADPKAKTFQDQVRAYGTVLSLDRLTPLYNAALINAAQMQAAEAKQEASQAADARAQTLLKAFSTAKAQAETATAAVAIDTAGIATAQAQTDALRNTAVQDWGPRLGDAIVARTSLASDLVARRTVLVQLSVEPGMAVAPPRTLPFALGDASPVEGRFVSEAAQADPKVQSIGYLYVVPATAGLLPGASVIALLPKGSAQAGFDIPPSAVVWQAGKPWMYLRTAPDRFERRSIESAALPTPEGGYIVPAGTLAGRDRTIVTVGAQVLLSQEMRAQIPSTEDDN